MIVQDAARRQFQQALRFNENYTAAQLALQALDKLEALARVLETDPDELERKLNQRSGKEFVWLKRRLLPDDAARIRVLESSM